MERGKCPYGAVSCTDPTSALMSLVPALPVTSASSHRQTQCLTLSLGLKLPRAWGRLLRALILKGLPGQGFDIEAWRRGWGRPGPFIFMLSGFISVCYLALFTPPTPPSSALIAWRGGLTHNLHVTYSNRRWCLLSLSGLQSRNVDSQIGAHVQSLRVKGLETLCWSLPAFQGRWTPQPKAHEC